MDLNITSPKQSLLALLSWDRTHHTHCMLLSSMSSHDGQPCCAGRLSKAMQMLVVAEARVGHTTLRPCNKRTHFPTGRYP